MNDGDFVEVLEVYAAYRGQRIEPGSVELREFAHMFGGAIRENVEAAIRAAAERDGRVFLETVARRHRDLCDARLERAIAEKRAAHLAEAGAPQFDRPGWPCAVGSPVGSYLTWISARAMWGLTAGRATAARYVRAGLVLESQADYVLESIPVPGAATPDARSRAGKQAVEACEREMGSWARVAAEQAVANAPVISVRSGAPESAGRGA